MSRWTSLDGPGSSAVSAFNGGMHAKECKRDGRALDELADFDRTRCFQRKNDKEVPSTSSVWPDFANKRASSCANAASFRVFFLPGRSNERNERERERERESSSCFLVPRRSHAVRSASVERIFMEIRISRAETRTRVKVSNQRRWDKESRVSISRRYRFIAPAKPRAKI